MIEKLLWLLIVPCFFLAITIFLIALFAMMFGPIVNLIIGNVS